MPCNCVYTWVEMQKIPIKMDFRIYYYFNAQDAFCTRGELIVMIKTWLIGILICYDGLFHKNKHKIGASILFGWLLLD